MLIKDNYAVAEFKDIVNYKIKWTFKILKTMPISLMNMFNVKIVGKLLIKFKN